MASDFVEADVTVTGGTLSNWSTVSSSARSDFTPASSSSYTATFTPAAGSTSDGVVSVASSKFCDSAGNFNADGSDANNSVTLTIDTTTTESSESSNSSTANETARNSSTQALIGESEEDNTSEDNTELSERYLAMPASNQRLGPNLAIDLSQYSLPSRNRVFELGTSGDGVGTALNIFGVTLLALLNPAESIRNFLENLKGSDSKETCHAADTWPGSDFCSEIKFQPAAEQQLSDQLLRPQNQSVASGLAIQTRLGSAGSLDKRITQPWLQLAPLDALNHELHHQDSSSHWS